METHNNSQKSLGKKLTRKRRSYSIALGMRHAFFSTGCWEGNSNAVFACIYNDLRWLDDGKGSVLSFLDMTGTISEIPKRWKACWACAGKSNQKHRFGCTRLWWEPRTTELPRTRSERRILKILLSTVLQL